MFHLPISKNWIVSQSASRVYLVCACSVMALFATLIAVSLAIVTSGVRSLADAPSALVLAKAFIFPGVCGTALLSVAMWYFWFSFDQSSSAKKTLWFLPLYLMPLLGPVLYYFLVYQRQVPTFAPKPL